MRLRISRSSGLYGSFDRLKVTQLRLFSVTLFCFSLKYDVFAAYLIYLPVNCSVSSCYQNVPYSLTLTNGNAQCRNLKQCIMKCTVVFRHAYKMASQNGSLYREKSESLLLQQVYCRLLRDCLRMHLNFLIAFILMFSNHRCGEKQSTAEVCRQHVFR